MSLREGDIVSKIWCTDFIEMLRPNIIAKIAKNVWIVANIGCTKDF